MYYELRTCTRITTNDYGHFITLIILLLLLLWYVCIIYYNVRTETIILLTRLLLYFILIIKYNNTIILNDEDDDMQVQYAQERHTEGVCGGGFHRGESAVAERGGGQLPLTLIRLETLPFGTSLAPPPSLPRPLYTECVYK